MAELNFTKDTVIVCIGTDKVIYDSLGPLVGTLLKEKNFKYPVYGTLDQPIHAMNTCENMNVIQNEMPNAKIIGIDACVGEYDQIGTIKIREAPISPGKGVGKELPLIGEMSIVGFTTNNCEYIFEGSPIRLSLVYKMANQIVDMLIKKAIQDTRQSNPR